MRWLHPMGAGPMLEESPDPLVQSSPLGRGQTHRRRAAVGPERAVVVPPAEPQPEALERLRLGLQIMALRALGDPDAAEEVVQETLVRAWEAMRAGRPDDPEKLGAFVRGIARHVIADTHRTRRRSPSLEAVHPEALGSDRDNPLAALISAEERASVRLALSRLSAGDREILRLSFFEGLTPVAIAERLGEPALRIRKRKSRALGRLRRAFPRRQTANGHESAPSPTDEQIERDGSEARGGEL